MPTNASYLITELDSGSQPRYSVLLFALYIEKFDFFIIYLFFNNEMFDSMDIYMH